MKKDTMPSLPLELIKEIEGEPERLRRASTVLEGVTAVAPPFSPRIESRLMILRKEMGPMWHPLLDNRTLANRLIALQLYLNTSKIHNTRHALSHIGGIDIHGPQAVSALQAGSIYRMMAHPTTHSVLGLYFFEEEDAERKKRLALEEEIAKLEAMPQELAVENKEKLNELENQLEALNIAKAESLGIAYYCGRKEPLKPRVGIDFIVMPETKSARPIDVLNTHAAPVVDFWSSMLAVQCPGGGDQMMAEIPPQRIRIIHDYSDPRSERDEFIAGYAQRSKIEVISSVEAQRFAVSHEKNKLDTLPDYYQVSDLHKDERQLEELLIEGKRQFNLFAYEAAKKCFRQIIEQKADQNLTPAVCLAKINLATILFAEGNFDEAKLIMVELEQKIAVEIDTPNKTPIELRNLIFYKTLLSDSSFQILSALCHHDAYRLEEIIQQIPIEERPDVHFQLGKMYIDLFLACRDVEQEGKQLQPHGDRADQAPVVLQLPNLNKQIKLLRKAIVSLEEAVTNTTDPLLKLEAYEQLAFAYFQLYCCDPENSKLGRQTSLVASQGINFSERGQRILLQALSELGANGRDKRWIPLIVGRKKASKASLILAYLLANNIRDTRSVISVDRVVIMLKQFAELKNSPLIGVSAERVMEKWQLTPENPFTYAYMGLLMSRDIEQLLKTKKIDKEIKSIIRDLERHGLIDVLRQYQPVDMQALIIQAKMQEEVFAPFLSQLHSGISDPEFKEFCSALKSNKNLRKLSLPAFCDFNEVRFQLLMGSIPVDNLVSLELPTSLFSTKRNKNFDALIEFLDKAKKLEHLCIDMSSFTESDVKIFFAKLSSHKKITSLTITGNIDINLFAKIEALQESSGLSRIYMHAAFMVDTAVLRPRLFQRGLQQGRRAVTSFKEPALFSPPPSPAPAPASAPSDVSGNSRNRRKDNT